MGPDAGGDPETLAQSIKDVLDIRFEREFFFQPLPPLQQTFKSQPAVVPISTPHLVLHHIVSTAIPGNPHSVLQAMELFATNVRWLKVCGEKKRKVMEDVLS